MRAKSVLALLFISLLIVPAGIAQSFTPWDAVLIDVKSEIRKGEDAIVQLAIVNNGETSDNYRLLVDSFSFNVRSEPSSDYLGGMVVPAHDSKRTTLYLRPSASLEPGIYQLTLSIRAQGEGTEKRLYPYVRVRSDSSEIRDYFAAVDRILTVPAQVDPREPVPIQINLRNRNAKNITDLTILLDSKTMHKEVHTALEPLDSKVVNVQIDVPRLTAPQNDVLSMTLIVDNDTVQQVVREPFEIQSYSEVHTTPSDAKKSFLGKDQDFDVYHEGNTPRDYTLEIKTSLIDSFFTRSTPPSYTINKDDATYLAWDLKLEPDQRITVRTQTSYVPLVVFIILLIAGVSAYYVFRSPITISKEASVLSTREGGIAKMKVLIHVKNRTGRAFDKVSIIDKIPNIVELEKEHDVGTIRPTRVFQSPKQGTTIKYEIGSLEKFEERLITYKVRSKLTILGGINLPPGMVVYTDKKGKEHVVRSSRLDVNL